MASHDPDPEEIFADHAYHTVEIEPALLASQPATHLPRLGGRVICK